LVRVYSQFPCGNDVFFTIVRKKQRFRGVICGRNRMLENFSVRFQRTDFVGQHMPVEIVQDAVIRSNELKVPFVRVGYKDQGVFPFQLGQQVLRDQKIRQKHR